MIEIEWAHCTVRGIDFLLRAEERRTPQREDMSSRLGRRSQEEKKSWRTGKREEEKTADGWRGSDERKERCASSSSRARLKKIP